MMTVEELLTAIDTWRAAETAYIAAYRANTELGTLASGDECERAKDILNDEAENLVGIPRHNSTAFATVTTLADEIRRLRSRVVELETFGDAAMLVEHAQMKARIQAAMRIEPPTVDGILITRDYAFGHRAALSKVRAALEVE